MWKWGIVHLIFAVIAVSDLHVSQTQAQDWYLEADAGAAYLELPQQQFFADRGESAPFARLANLDTDDGEGWGMGLGLRFGRSLDCPLLWADNTRIELGGFYISQNHSTDASFTDGGAGERFGWVVLDGSNGFGTPDAATLNTSVQRRDKFGGYDLLVRQDRHADGCQGYSLYGGFSAFHLYQDILATGVIATSVELDELLNTDYFGGKIGVSRWLSLNDCWSAMIDGGVGFYGARTRYRGVYTDSTPSTVIEERQSREFALGASLQISVSRQIFAGCALSAFANAQYLNYAPQIEYGAIGAPAASHTPVITRDELLSMMTGLRLTIVR